LMRMLHRNSQITFCYAFNKLSVSRNRNLTAIRKKLSYQLYAKCCINNFFNKNEGIRVKYARNEDLKKLK
jgi:hypothetical protein